MPRAFLNTAACWSRVPRGPSDRTNEACAWAGLGCSSTPWPAAHLRAGGLVARACPTPPLARRLWAQQGLMGAQVLWPAWHAYAQHSLLGRNA